MKRCNLALALAFGAVVLVGRVNKSIAITPPGIDIPLGLISDYAKTNLAAGTCRAFANGGVGANSVDNDSVTNFSNFFGETDIDLHCEHHNESASAYDNIVWKIPSSGKDGLFKQKDYNALASPPKPGEKDPQTAYADWQISYKGQIVQGVGAPPTNVSDPKIASSPIASLLPSAQLIQNSGSDSIVVVDCIEFSV